MQIPLVNRLLPPGKRVGVLTFDASRLTPEHFVAAGAPPDTPVVGMEDGHEFWRFIAHEEKAVDIAAARADILAGGEKLVTQNDNTGAVVLECTNMVPFTRALNKRLGLPVYDIYAFVNWFHAGLIRAASICPATRCKRAPLRGRYTCSAALKGKAQRPTDPAFPGRPSPG
jgi:hypothetical protein